MIDTGNTVTLATRSLKENGAAAIFVLVSHGKDNHQRIIYHSD